MDTIGVSQKSVSCPPEGGLTFLEQLHALSVQLCPSSKVPFLTAIKGNKAILMRGSCGMWACRVCGARNGKRWNARLLEHMNTHKGSGRWFFLTITAHQSWRGQRASVINLRQGWKKLYNRMLRKYGVSEYVRVWEFHKDGSFHLHVLIRRKIGKRWLRDNSVACGMGYIVDSSKAKNPGMVAGYVAKYLLKSFNHADKYPRGMRRIECSRNWTKFKTLEDDFDEWIVNATRDGQKRNAFHLKSKGLQIVDKVPTDAGIERAMREEDDFYADSLRDKTLEPH